MSAIFRTEQEQATALIRRYLESEGVPADGEIAWNPIPFSGEWGISTSFFKIAAQERREAELTPADPLPVPARAQQLAEGATEALEPMDEFARVEAVKGYLNLYFSPQEFSRRAVDAVLNAGQGYGCGEPRGERVMVEFSQPNTHKSLHVGHLRNVILGAAMCNILACAGYEVIRANYIGDIGLHVIKWLWYYLEFLEGETPGEDKTRWMGDRYAEAIRYLEEHPEREREVRNLFARWDRRDPEVVALWEKTRAWSLEGFEQVYDMLGVSFDRVYYESEVEESGKQLVEELIEQGIAEDERPEGPVIIRLDELLGLEKEQYRVLVVLRSDDTSLYATKDLPLAIQKFSEYDLDRSLYVIDVRQSLYLQQIFKTLEIMGYPWATLCEHLAYEIVNLPGNVTMSSREGTVVLLEDLVREAISRAYEIVSQKNPGLAETEKQAVARAVALGGLKFPMLSRENTKVVTFDWETALDFNGHAAPYIQYAHVRANSILRRMEAPLPDSRLPGHALEPAEIELIDRITRLPDEVQRAAEELKPLPISNLAFDLARAFNDFYNQCPVLQAPPEVRDARLRLVAASKTALANALRLLGIVPPDVM